MDVFHIASAEVDDVGGGTDEARETNGCILSRAAVLFHGEQQEIGEVFFGVELKVVEKDQLAFFFDEHVEVAVADLDENTMVCVAFHYAVDEDAA